MPYFELQSLTWIMHKQMRQKLQCGFNQTNIFNVFIALKIQAVWSWKDDPIT